MQKVERGLPASGHRNHGGKSWWVLPGGSQEGLHCILIERVDEMLEVSELF